MEYSNDTLVLGSFDKDSKKDSKGYESEFLVKYHHVVKGYIEETMTRDAAIELILEIYPYLDLVLPENFFPKEIKDTQWETETEIYDGSPDSELYTSIVYLSSTNSMRKKLSYSDNFALAGLLSEVLPFLSIKSEEVTTIPLYFRSHRKRAYTPSEVKPERVRRAKKMKPFEVKGIFFLYLQDCLAIDKVICPKCGGLHHINYRKCECGYRNPDPTTRFTYMPLYNETKPVTPWFQVEQILTRHRRLKLDPAKGPIRRYSQRAYAKTITPGKVTLPADAGTNLPTLSMAPGFYDYLVMNLAVEAKYEEVNKDRFVTRKGEIK